MKKKTKITQKKASTKDDVVMTCYSNASIKNY